MGCAERARPLSLNLRLKLRYSIDTARFKLAGSVRLNGPGWANAPCYGASGRSAQARRSDPLQAREKLARQVQVQVGNRRQQRRSAPPLALRETQNPEPAGAPERAGGPGNHATTARPPRQPGRSPGWPGLARWSHVAIATVSLLVACWSRWYTSSAFSTSQLARANAILL